MLDDDGLCRIQRNTSQETLANICRKYPRLIGRREEGLYLSMAASCPVIARTLWRGEVTYYFWEDAAGAEKLAGRDVPVGREVWEYFRLMEERAALYRERIHRWELFGDSLGRLFELLAGLLPSMTPEERKAWEAPLMYYADAPGEELGKRAEAFLGQQGGAWEQFTWNYLAYRFMGRQAMYREAPEVTFCQGMGEVFLVQSVCLLEHWRQEGMTGEEICRWIERMYRLCANGEERREDIQRIFSGLYREKALWISLLFDGKERNISHG